MNKVLSFFILLVLLVSCKQQEFEKQFLLSITINGAENSKVYLKRYNGDGFQTVDSTYVVNGSFQFKGAVDFPELYRIFINGRDEYIPLFIENSSITVDADTGNMFYAKVKGSESDSIYKKFCRKIDSIDLVMKPVIEDYKLAEVTNNIELIKRSQAILDSSYARQVLFTKQFVKENKSSTVALFILYKYLSSELSYNELQSLSLIIDTSLNNSVYSKSFNNQLEIMERTEIGQKATDFSLPDTTGTSVKLSSFLGKYVLIDFWASWCPACRDENPNVVNAYKKFSSKGFEVLGISFDSKRDKWLKAIHDDHLNWTHISDLRSWENAVGILYGIRSIPSNLLIGPDGVILAKNLHGEELQKELTKYLK